MVPEKERKMHLKLALALVVMTVTLAQTDNTCTKIYFDENDFIDIYDDSIAKDNNGSYVCAPTTPPAETTTTTTTTTTSTTVQTTNKLANFVVGINHKQSIFSSIFNYNNEIFPLSQNLKCLGVIISNRFVLSLKTCITTYAERLFEILVSQPGRNVATYDIAKILTYNDYDDIALFATRQYMNVEAAQIANLATGPFKGNMELYTLASDTTPTITVLFNDRSKCNTLLRTISNTELCMGNVPCNTKPGSPIIDETNKVVGLHYGVSWLNCFLGIPSAALNVAPFSSWINNHKNS